MSTSTTPAAIQLRPWISVPLAMMGTSIFFSILVGRMVAFRVAWDPWWMAPITFVLAGLAVTYLWLGVIMLASRREGVITIEEHRIVFRGVATPREQVAVVRYDYDATFKGTRIELVDGSFVRLAAGTHRHRKVLAAFRRNNYPVT